MQTANDEELINRNPKLAPIIRLAPMIIILYSLFSASAQATQSQSFTNSAANPSISYSACLSDCNDKGLSDGFYAGVTANFSHDPVSIFAPGQCSIRAYPDLSDAINQTGALATGSCTFDIGTYVAKFTKAVSITGYFAINSNAVPLVQGLGSVDGVFLRANGSVKRTHGFNISNYSTYQNDYGSFGTTTHATYNVNRFDVSDQTFTTLPYYAHYDNVAPVIEGMKVVLGGSEFILSEDASTAPVIDSLPDNFITTISDGSFRELEPLNGGSLVNFQVYDESNNLVTSTSAMARYFNENASVANAYDSDASFVFDAPDSTPYQGQVLRIDVVASDEVRRGSNSFGMVVNELYEGSYGGTSLNIPNTSTKSYYFRIASPNQPPIASYYSDTWPAGSAAPTSIQVRVEDTDSPVGAIAINDLQIVATGSGLSFSTEINPAPPVATVIETGANYKIFDVPLDFEGVELSPGNNLSVWTQWTDGEAFVADEHAFITVEADTIPPSINLISHADGSAISLLDSFVFEVYDESISDSETFNSPIVEITLDDVTVFSNNSVNATTAVSSMTTYQVTGEWSGAEVAYGSTINLNIRAYDPAGNESSQTYSFVGADVNPPAVEIADSTFVDGEVTPVPVGTLGIRVRDAEFAAATDGTTEPLTPVLRIYSDANSEKITSGDITRVGYEADSFLYNIDNVDWSNHLAGDNQTYYFEVTGYDMAGNEVTEVFTQIQEADLSPEITFNKAEDEFIDNLNSLSFTVDSSREYTITSVTVQWNGQAVDNSTIAAGDTYTFSNDLFLYSDGNNSLIVDVEAQDVNGATGNARYTYNTSVISLDPVSTPVGGFFQDRDGKVALKTPQILVSESEAITGSAEVWYRLISGPGNLVVNSLELSAGQVLKSTYNFTAVGPTVEFPVKVDAPGDYKLLVVVDGAQSAYTLDVSGWDEAFDGSTGAAFSTSKPSYSRYYEKAVLDIDTSRCAIVSGPNGTDSQDGLSGTRCYIDFTFPEGVVDPAKFDDKVAFYYDSQGVRTVQFAVKTKDMDGQTVILGSGSADIEFVDPVFSIAAEISDSEISRFIEEYRVSLRNGASGIECDMTFSENQAVSFNARTSPKCLIELDSAPAESEKSIYRDSVEIAGYINESSELTVSGTMSVFIDGQKTEADTFSIDIVAVDPEPPVINLSPRDTWEGTDYWVGSNNAGDLIGNAYVEAEPADVNVSVFAGDAKIFERTYGYSRGSSIRIDSVSGDAWDKTSYRVSAKYVRAEQFSTENTFDVVAPPKRSYLELEHEYAANDLEDMTAEAFFSRYEPDAFGDWKVQLIREIDSENSLPLGQESGINAESEVASFTFATSEMKGRQKLIAEASAVNSYGIDYKIKSRPSYFYTFSGAAVEGQIQGYRIEGEAPLSAYFSFSPTGTRFENLSLGDVEYYIDFGSGWEKVNSSGKSMGYRFTEEGKYHVKAVSTNKYSGETFESESVEVYAFSVPDIDIEDPGYIVVGEDVTMRAFDQEDTNRSLEIEWYEYGKQEPFATGEMVTMTMERGRSYTVKAKYADVTSDSDRAWDSAVTSVKVIFPYPLSARIDYSFYSEIGTQYEAKASVYNPYSKVKGTTLVKGFIYDGVEYPGDTFRINFESEGEKVVTFYVEVPEYPESRYETEFKVTAYTYSFPDFYVIQDLRYESAPTLGRVYIRSLGDTQYLEGLKYELIPDPAIDAFNVYGSYANIEIENPGVYPVTARVTDDRGNVWEEQFSLDIKVPPVPQQEAYIYSDSSYNKAPSRLTFGIRLSKMERYDFITSMTATINGETLPPKDASRIRYDAMDPGLYEVEMTAETYLGHTLQASQSITLGENQPPSCEISEREYSTYYVFYGSCTDPEKDSLSYTWAVDGAEHLINRYYIKVNKGDFTTVGIYATDKNGLKGDAAEFTLDQQEPPPEAVP